MDNHTLSIEERVARLEGALGWLGKQQRLSLPLFIISTVLSIAAIYFSIYGLGLPNHYYQVVLGILTLLLAYHRGWLIRPVTWYQYILTLLNAVQLSFLLKLFIGSGARNPFFWLMYPSFTKSPSEGKWYSILPDLAWQPTPLAGWEVDLTVIQTFLLVITLIGALFRFQPFVSLTALLLILVSVPAFSEFNWAWVFPAIATSSLALYLQSKEPANQLQWNQLKQE